MNTTNLETMYLDQTVSSQKRGEAKGIVSICSAHPFVLEAAFRQAMEWDGIVLIESTCNQVNQFGGYTNLTPAQFVGSIHEMARHLGFPSDRILLGGDHLGPEVWKSEPAASAMDKARTLVHDYISAGYLKIHLDASMKLADDPPAGALDPALSASRAADMALVAEKAHLALGEGAEAPRYVIGTEVPVPGGARQKEEHLHVSAIADASRTIEVTRQAFIDRGLHAAWERVIALVVQPGVEFGDDFVLEYQREAAAPLVKFIEVQPGLVYEAHSTDYQTREALRQMVEDHFAILKVGPALTFAFREGVLALSLIEAELLEDSVVQPSGILEALENAMLAYPRYWAPYYPGDPSAQRLRRKYSLSDRVRYYWTIPEVQQSLGRLITNLSQVKIPPSMLSQHLPLQYDRFRQGRLRLHPKDLLLDKIGLVLDDYEAACGIT